MIGISPVSSPRKTSTNNDVYKEPTGPTLSLGYDKNYFKGNPISSFMYFVPLISWTTVYQYISTNNGQQIGIIAYQKKVTAKSFIINCDLVIRGDGFHLDTFDPYTMIALNSKGLKKDQPLTHVLDHIKFQGQGFVTITVKGTISGSVPNITEMHIHFNARGTKSPVTIGLYDVEPKDGTYKFQNRSNLSFARVNMLTFSKTGQTPHMAIKFAGISKTQSPDGFLSSIKGTFANLFIKPVEVNSLGNQTLLDFGLALFQKKPEFTFPLAQNLQE